MQTMGTVRRDTRLWDTYDREVDGGRGLRESSGRGDTETDNNDLYV